MNEQQLAAVKRALEALEKSLPRLAPYGEQDWLDSCKAITALQSIIAQHALDKKAENARELGLSYDTPLSSFVRSNDEAKAEVMERVIDKATEEQKAVIGCVNHDCDKCKAVQEPVAQALSRDAVLANIAGWLRHLADDVTIPYFTNGAFKADCNEAADVLLATPPALQPVPVETYHDGKTRPVAPKPWVGLTIGEIQDLIQFKEYSPFALAEDIEAKLKEKNHG
jgi:hypothetical protein